MKSISKMYKTFSNDEIKQLNIKINRLYYYNSEEDIKFITETSFENVSSQNMFQLVDDNYEWDAKLDSLFLDIDVEINNCNCLFGIDGSCYEDAIIGVGLSWKAEKSRIKRCVKLGQITKTDSIVNLDLKKIELENISSNVEFRIFFYIIKPGKIGGNPYFGNEEGLVLYDYSAWTIVVEGNGSIFPVVEIDDSSKPLWDIFVDCSQIDEDFFDDDHVRLILNKKHPLYSLIQPKSENYNHLVFNEIISSAITLIVLNIRKTQENDYFDLNMDYATCSILQAICYFSSNLDFKVNGTYSELLCSIKKFFDKE